MKIIINKHKNVLGYIELKHVDNLDNPDCIELANTGKS